VPCQMSKLRHGFLCKSSLGIRLPIGRRFWKRNEKRPERTDRTDPGCHSRTEFRAIDVEMTVFFKEFRVSVTVGILLAIVIFLRIIIIDGSENWLLALTVSLSLMLTIIIAKGVGCSLPIFAKRLKLDPAIMAAPIITTIVDALSLVIYFQLATAILRVN